MRDASAPSTRVSRLSLWPPPDLHPRKVVPAAQAPREVSLSAPGLPPAPTPRKAPGGGRRGRPLPPLQLPSHRHPGTHAPTLAAEGTSPPVQDWPAVGSADPHFERHVPVPTLAPPGTRSTASPRSPPAAATPARPAPCPLPLPTAGSGLPLGLPRPQLHRVQMPPPLPSRCPPPSSRCHVCQSMRTRQGEAAGKKCLLGIVVFNKAGLEDPQAWTCPQGQVGCEWSTKW